MIPSRRVAVTGVGIVSPLGAGRNAFWRALAAGESGIVEQDGGRLAAPVRRCGSIVTLLPPSVSHP